MEQAVNRHRSSPEYSSLKSKVTAILECNDNASGEALLFIQNYIIPLAIKIRSLHIVRTEISLENIIIDYNVYKDNFSTSPNVEESFTAYTYPYPDQDIITHQELWAIAFETAETFYKEGKLLKEILCCIPKRDELVLRFIITF